MSVLLNSLILRILRFGGWGGSSVGLATGYRLDGPGIESRWGRDFPHVSTPALGPTQPPVQWVSGLSPGVKSGRGVTLTPHPLLVPWSRKSRAIPLLPVWAVRPVQSLSACTRVQFTFLTFYVSGAGSVPVLRFAFSKTKCYCFMTIYILTEHELISCQ